MRLTLEGPLETEDHLPKHLSSGKHSTDVGRTWWIGVTWHIWTGIGWQKAIATSTAPESVTAA
jgi:hypothetical protein